MLKPDSSYTKSFLFGHVESILDFYDPIVVDESGGYFQNFKDNGEVFNGGFKQLVSSTRIIVNYARAATALNRSHYKDIAEHGLTYLEQVHWQPSTESYAWTLQDHKALDMTQQAYGYAFVMLAYAAVHKHGVRDGLSDMRRTFDLLENKFWQADFGLYADEISPTGVLSDYRGQNSNMHLCEAMIAAFEASAEPQYLERAKVLAKNITQGQANLTNGLVWEHYQVDFQPDWEYNKEDPKNLYRPWGFQPGHQTEWAKLLIAIYRHSKESWLLEKAQELFDLAYEKSWDKEHGGLIYGFAPDGSWCDDDKYFWVQAESFAAAAMLYQETHNIKYLDAYRELWDYSWHNLVDHQYGAWFRVLKRNNDKYSDEKSSAGAKCDYHTLGACLDALVGL
ncbi:AGE family epimerase/isomerase [Paraglaciecola sp.]|uniref:AGE family epimerase/isomerase n=1 Tax=Paraglaciecola sp. TaxID=1920173 RepID=UPI0032668A63